MIQYFCVSAPAAEAAATAAATTTKAATTTTAAAVNPEIFAAGQTLENYTLKANIQRSH